MFDPTRLLGGMLSGGFSRSSSGSAMPSLVGGVAGLAGVAALGGVAYLAYQAYQQRSQPNAPPGYPPPQQAGGYPYPPQADPYAYPQQQPGGYPQYQAPPAPVDPNAYVPYYLRPQAPPAPAAPPATADHETALLLVRAMIAAANADGQIDEAERGGILARMTEAGVDGPERDALVAELARPLPPSALVAGVRSPEMAAQVYAVSLAAIKADTDAEKAYLRGLAAMLGLPPERVLELHGHMGVAPP